MIYFVIYTPKVTCNSVLSSSGFSEFLDICNYLNSQKIYYNIKSYSDEQMDDELFSLFMKSEHRMIFPVEKNNSEWRFL